MKFSSLIVKLGGVVVSLAVVLMPMPPAESDASHPLGLHSASGPEQKQQRTLKTVGRIQKNAGYRHTKQNLLGNISII